MAVLLLMLSLAFSLLIERLLRPTEKNTPAIPYSDCSPLRHLQSWRQRCYRLPRIFIAIALALLIWAALSPAIGLERHHDTPLIAPGTNTSSEGIAIYLVLDVSGSMSEASQDSAFDHSFSKLDQLKEVVKSFILGSERDDMSGRTNDLIGLISFARTAQVLCPLTTSRDLLLQRLAQLSPVTKEELDGTAIGYALLKTTDLITATRYFATRDAHPDSQPYAIRKQIVFLITDGFNRPNPLDRTDPYRFTRIEEATHRAKEVGVSLYIAIINPDLGDRGMEQDLETLQKAARSTNGGLFLLQEGTNMKEIFHTFDTIEKSPIQEQGLMLENDTSASPPLAALPYGRLAIACALIFIVISIVFETLVLRPLP